MIVLRLAGLMGLFSIGIAMLVLARLSWRLGRVTHARPYYVGNYLGVAFVWIGGLVRLYFITQGPDALRAPNQDLVYTLLSDGLPAVGVTLGLIVTWYYWSWLLAERD